MLDINKIIDIPPGAKRVLLQLPEGIMMRAIEIADALEKKGIDVILSAEPCYGACDLRIAEAKLCNADLIVHLGHNEFYRKIKTDIPVLYMPLEINADIKGIDFSAIKENRVGLLTAVQHLGMLDEIAERLKQAGKQAVIGGQILGCWIANARKIAKDVDCFLVVGSGSFHTFVLAGEPKKIYMLDLEKREIRSMDKELALAEKKRYARIYRVRDAKSFGIIVSSKPGQFNMKEAERIKRLLEKRHKKACILIMDNIGDAKLMIAGIDAFINTACPRLTDNAFSMPVINAKDIEKIFG